MSAARSLGRNHASRSSRREPPRSQQDLNKPSACPNTSAGDITAGILHFGVGNFHRAHQAVYLDDLFNLGLDHDWGLVGAGSFAMTDTLMRETLMRQDYPDHRGGAGGHGHRPPGSPARWSTS
jgi:hypothetical protein